MLNHQIRNTLIRVDRHGQLGIQVALLNHEVLYGISGIGGVVLINDLLHTLSVRNDGTYIDGIKTSDETLKSLWKSKKDAILFRIGVKPDAENVGGMNLFGAHFGNLSQHINIKVDYIH